MLINVQLENKASRLHITFSLIKKEPFEDSVKTVTHASATAKNHDGLFRLMLAVLAIPLRPRQQFLDVRTLPDHLKRDMGFMDGNDPAGRHL